jgi:ketosteroid isomerase-like protein
MHLEIDRDQYVMSLRAMSEMRWHRETFVRLATRGERLYLIRGRFDGADGAIGPSVIEYLLLGEVNERGEFVGQVVYAVDDLDAAYAELDARYDAGEAARLFAGAWERLAAIGPAFLAREWDALTAMFRPDFVLHDHRPLGWGRLDHSAWIESMKALAALAPDARIRTDHMWLSERGALVVALLQGTHEGGVFEEPRVMVYEFAPDGRFGRWDFYTLDQLDEARARFAAIAAPPSRRVRANAATANNARFAAALTARDGDAISNLMAEDAEIVEHPTGAVYDREGVLRSIRSLLAARAPTFRQETLATLGDRLALSRVVYGAGGLVRGQFDVGAYETDNIHVVEVDADGRRRRTERFAVERLGDAVARLYERYADLMPEGPGRARATATARAVATILGPLDRDRYGTAFTPTLRFDDHRRVGVGSLHGVDAFMGGIRALLDVADTIANRLDDVLGLSADAFLARWTNFGTDRAGGGAFERPFLLLWVFGPDGLAIRGEQFDAECEAQALARLDELTATPVCVPFENAATRASDRFAAAWEARDWGRISAHFTPEFRALDRRRFIQLDLDRDQHVETLRMRFEMSRSDFSAQVLATRGERFALGWHRYELADRDVGQSELRGLWVSEVDECGVPLVVVLFDPDDFDAAYAELDDRYAAGEATPFAGATAWRRTFADALAGRDWGALADLYTPDLVITDHRPLGWETLRGPAAFIDSLRSLVDLSPDVRLRSDHVRMGERAHFQMFTWIGTREGGAFEVPKLVVSENDGRGKIRRIDVYDVDQFDEARACFEALAARKTP